MPELNSGDTAWVLASAALVLLMTPGLAFFYGGMVRAKSVLNMLMMSFVTIGIVSILWVLYGFSVAFGKDTTGGWIGNFDMVGLGEAVNDLVTINGAPDAPYLIPLLAFAAFQLMFAIITPALISGAVADRAKFLGWCVFVVLWVSLVYFPVAHWVFDFGGGEGDSGGILAAGKFFGGKGVLDFAGGTAVHVNAGAAALALAIVLGRRVGWKRDPMRPHSLPLVLLGAGLLWFGWFGFNAGSALGANGLAALAFVNTQVATAAAALGWIIVERIRTGGATSLGIASGAVSGLVAITPACAFVAPWAAVVIGLLTGAVCSLAVSLKFRFNFDDSLDVVGIHLVGGAMGSILIGFFGTTRVNELGFDGLFYGGGLALLGRQIASVLIVGVFSFTVALLLGLLVEKTIGFRVSRDAEVEGIDLAEHLESAYDLGVSGAGGSLPRPSAHTQPQTPKVDA
jgi:Amt family ammonium transporter